MSNPSPSSQLPVTAYFDPALYAQEQALLFAQSPRYIGHSLAAPEVGDFYTLPQENGGRALVNTPSGIELISNVCRHRQAILLQAEQSNANTTNANGQTTGQGKTGDSIVCPLHRWTYNTHGELLAAPHFEVDPCLNLNRYGLHNWNGLLFEDAAHNPLSNHAARRAHTDLAGIGCIEDLDFSGYVFHKAHVHECNYNWKSFIEVYLEDYHVEPFHPGLGQFVTTEDLRWEFKERYSVQTVGVNSHLGSAGSPVYQRWHEAVMKYTGGKTPKHGAIWLTYYPNVMVEWYPHVLVVSTLYPKGPEHTTNIVEFFYPEEIAAFEPEFIAAQQAAYLETCVEDDEIALRMDAGRKALMLRGDNEVGPYQSPMEDGMQHFHEWYRREMGEMKL
jgi:choline monooxygenase